MQVILAKTIMIALNVQCKAAARLMSGCRAAWLMIMIICIGLGTIAQAGLQHLVSQKNRAFSPAALEVQSGDSIEFVNDDGELLHHAYLDNDRFSFDTGDQGPGSKTLVAFPTKGSFTVLCGIHPKMKLVVQVR